MAVWVPWRLCEGRGRGAVGGVVEVDGNILDDGGPAFGAEVWSWWGFADVETPVQEGIMNELYGNM